VRLSATLTAFQADQLFERNAPPPTHSSLSLSIYLNVRWRLSLSSHLTMGRTTSSCSSSIDSSNHPSLSSASSHLPQLNRDLSTDLRLGLSISSSQHNASSIPRYSNFTSFSLFSNEECPSIYIYIYHRFNSQIILSFFVLVSKRWIINKLSHLQQKEMSAMITPPSLSRFTWKAFQLAESWTY
jgi:hypothetical protein